MTVWGTKTHQNKGTRESVRLDDAFDRTWLTWLQQETTTRRVREDQVYPATQETRKGKRAHDLSPLVTWETRQTSHASSLRTSSIE